MSLIRCDKGTNLYQRHLGRNQVVFDCVLNQFRVGLCIEHFHDSVLVKRYGPRCEIQRAGGFFHCFALRQELKHLALSFGEFLCIVPAAHLPDEARNYRVRLIAADMNVFPLRTSRTAVASSEAAHVFSK